jgi:hypothetical protein
MRWTDISQYFVLGCILVGGLGGFYYVRPNTTLQFIIGVATSVAYVIWGIMYHAIKKDLHTRVMIEYILMGAIAIVLFATILKT